MICHIVACGESGKYWNGKGFSIGVNDCFKFGYQTDILIVVNSFDKYPDRKKIIQSSIPREKLYALGTWSGHPKYEHIRYMNAWKGKLDKGKLYKSKTSPFIAVTMAFGLGYDKIVLWGVDFISHPVVKGQRLNEEVRNFESLQSALLKQGASMYLGGTEDFVNQGALRDLIPNFIQIENKRNVWC